MTEEPLERLPERESDEVWDRFDGAFAFRPNMQKFPAITEPAESITWSLDALDDRLDERKIDRIVTLICDALATCTPPGSSLLILQWHTTSYQLRPDLPPTDMFLPEPLTRHLPPGWPRSLYPYGEYPIAISEDFQYGSFGHPWERTLCLFGSDLLDCVADELTTHLPTIVRRGGQPVAPR